MLKTNSLETKIRSELRLLDVNFISLYVGDNIQVTYFDKFGSQKIKLFEWPQETSFSSLWMITPDFDQNR